MKRFRLFAYIFVLVFALTTLVSCRKQEYKVSFLYEDGTIIEEKTFKGSQNIGVSTPEKEGYNFLGWYLNDKKIELPYVFESNAKVYAKFEIKEYTYKFIVDGEIIKQGVGQHGSEIEYPSNPSKESTDQYEYEFAGWDNDAIKLLKDEIFKAEFTQTTKEYTYTFENENGDVIVTVTAAYGSEIKYPENPTKESTDEYDFNFVGWDNDDKTLTKNVVFKPIFDGVKKEYTYKFFNYDGTLLKEAKGAYGTLPIAPDDPTRPNEDGKKYEFAGWDKEIVALTEDVTYTATYKEFAVSLDGLKLSILGDSISTFYAEGSPMNSYYSGENQFYYPLYSSTIKTVDKTWWAQLLANTNMELGVNNSWSGSCAFGTGASAGQSDGRIFTINENGDPDILIIYLGTNDLVNAFTVEEYSSALVQIITKAKSLGVENIFLTTLGYTDYTGYNYTEAGRIAYNSEIREVAEEYGCGIVPLDEYIVEDNYMIYLGDKLHYNAKGATLLSKIYEKAIKEHFGITFNEDIEVEHKEQLPEGVLGKITATSNSSAGFWTEYATNVYLAESSSFLSPQYSFRYEITKNNANGKYYVTAIHVSGDSITYNSDYVIVISETHENRVALVESLNKVEIGSIVEFDVSLSFPVEIVFKAGDGNLPGEDNPTPEPDPDPNPEPEPDPDPTPEPGEKEGLEGLKVSILGDSISTFYVEGSSMNSLYGGENQFFYPRYSSTIKTVEKTWWAQLINNNKMVLGVNNSWSGSAAAGSGESAGQSDGRINTLDDNGMPDIVIIFLGTNDAGSQYINVEQYESALRTIVNKINALGETEIFITSLAHATNIAYMASRDEYNAVIKKVAQEMGCAIVPLDEYIVEDNCKIYLEDSLHYNAKGATLLSQIYEKTIKEHFGIPFEGEIEVEHQEQLPEGVLGKITATANSGFWTGYTNNVYLAPTSSSENPTFSLRIEITKNNEDGKYYVTKINENGAEGVKYNCDYVLLISSGHEEYALLEGSLENVVVGSIVEFDVSLSFPVEVIFKTGNGNLPDDDNPTPEPENPKVEGQLHIGAYNTGVWTKYNETAIIYSNDAMDKKSTFINFYLIKLTKDVDDYKITGLKPVDVNADFSEGCDYYVLIYRDLADKTYYENAQIGDTVVIHGDLTSGSCNLEFK